MLRQIDSQAAAYLKILISKSEILNKFKIQMTKNQNMAYGSGVLDLQILDFEIV